MHRRAAAHRETLHGEFANTLLSLAVDVRIEDIDYTDWAKSFPRSTQRHGVGRQVSTIRSKAESAGPGLYEFSTFTTALSQTCLCGDRKKKTLAQREHACPHCGLVEHRDILSAFLGLFVETVPANNGGTTDEVCLESANRFYPRKGEEALPFPRPDAAESRGSKTNKRRVRKPCKRSTERIKARRAKNRKSRSTEKSSQGTLTAPILASTKVEPRGDSMPTTKKPRP